MNIKCPDCGEVRVTLMNDRMTWACPCEDRPVSTQTFTIDPYAVRTQFAPATRPAYSKDTK